MSNLGRNLRFNLHVLFLGLTITHGVQALAGNGTNATTHQPTASIVADSSDGGCTFSFSGSSPIYTSGTTVVAPATSGGPSQTVPCDEFLRFAYAYVHSEIPPAASLMNTSSHVNTTSLILQSPTPTAPATLKYKDPNLTGCYAGTGGSTTFTLTSGDQLGYPDSNGQLVNIGPEPQTFNFPCSEFFGLYLPWHIRSAFAESPTCASYAQEPSGEHPHIAGLEKGNAHIGFECCGGCKFFASEAQVLYWSTFSSAGCSQSNATITSPTNLPSLSTDSATSQFREGKSVGGTFLTFPSLYVAFHGPVSVNNSCGVRGKIHYDPTIAIPPGGLSTLSYPSNHIMYAGEAPQTGVYDPDACHTYGLSNGSTITYLISSGNTSTFTTSVYYSMGPPYNPILLPPRELTALDPAWEACSSWDMYAENAYDVFFGLYDPPRALQPASAIVGPATTSPDPAPSSSTAPRPASIPSSTVPNVTAKPKTTPELAPLPSNSLDPATSVGNLASVIMFPFEDRPTQSKSESKSESKIESKIEDPIGTNAAQSVDPQLDSNHQPSQETPHATSLPPASDGSASPVTLSPSSPSSKANVLAVNPPGRSLSRPVLTIAENTYAMNSASQHLIGSQAPSPEDPTMEVDGTAYSLAPPSSPHLAEPKTVSVFPINGGQAITVDGAKYTSNTEGQYLVGSQTLSPCGSPINIHGAPYILPQTRKTSSPHDQANSPSHLINNNPILTIDGAPYTPDSASKYLLGSQTLIPGGPTITVNNVPYAIPSSVTTFISNGQIIPLPPCQTRDTKATSSQSHGG